MTNLDQSLMITCEITIASTSYISNAETVLYQEQEQSKSRANCAELYAQTVLSLTTMVILHYGLLVLLHLSPVYTQSTESSVVLAVMRCHYGTSSPHEISRCGKRSVTNARLALAISIIQV